EVHHSGDKLIVQADIPGLKKEDVSVEVRDRELTISGERRSESEHNEGRYSVRSAATALSGEPSRSPKAPRATPPRRPSKTACSRLKWTPLAASRPGRAVSRCAREARTEQ